MTRRAEVLAWIAVVAAPLAWFVQLVAGWMIVPPAFRDAREGWLLALSAAAFVVAAVATLIGLTLVRRTEPDDADPHHAARRFVAIGALWGGLLWIMLVVCTAAPIVLLGAGAEP
jgi:Ni/Fe-hydrogenase subunit HybB-like protein